jgi:ACS family tartrate transporter-like MFS transporter
MVAHSPANAVPADFSASDERRLTRKMALRLIPILAFAYFFNSLDKTNIGLAALSMNKALGLTDAAFGLASGLLFVGYAVFEVPSNIILYRVGARRWITRIMISWGIIAAATAFVQNEASLYVLRILLGIAEAGFYPGVLLFLSSWFPLRNRARMFSLFVFGGALSGVFGSPLTGLLLSRDTYFGFAGWRAMFILEGLPAVIIGLVCMKILVDRPSDATFLTDRERTWLTATLEAERDGVQASHGSHIGSLRMLKDIRVLVLAFVYFCAKFGQYALGFFLPLIIVAFETAAGHQYSTFQVSLLNAIPAALSVIPAVLWAMHSDRTRERIWHAALPMFTGCVGIALSLQFHSPLWIMVFICLANLGIGSQSAPFYQLPNSFLTGVAAAATFALINSVGNLGGFVAPYVFGLLKDWTGSFDGPMYLMSGVLGVGGILTLCIPAMLRAHSRRHASRMANAV